MSGDSFYPSLVKYAQGASASEHFVVALICYNERIELNDKPPTSGNEVTSSEYKNL